MIEINFENLKEHLSPNDCESIIGLECSSSIDLLMLDSGGDTYYWVNLTDNVVCIAHNTILNSILGILHDEFQHPNDMKILKFDTMFEFNQYARKFNEYNEEAFKLVLEAITENDYGGVKHVYFIKSQGTFIVNDHPIESNLLFHMIQEGFLEYDGEKEHQGEVMLAYKISNKGYNLLQKQEQEVITQQKAIV